VKNHPHIPGASPDAYSTAQTTPPLGDGLLNPHGTLGRCVYLL